MTDPSTSTMPGPPVRKLFHYDSTSRRLWIYGQRCHHGATGAVLCASAAIGLAARLRPPALAALLSGSALMLHDWHDRTVWFRRGWQD